MSNLDYSPALDGASVDPDDGVAGGSVDTLALYPVADRSGAPTATYGPAARISAGRYRFTVPDTVTGRYWPRVLWTEAAAAVQRTDDLPHIDLPIRDWLVTSPESIATRLGMPLPITVSQREILSDVILDAQAAVEAYLGRPIIPATYVDRRIWPSGGRWVLSQSPVLDVVSEVEEVDENSAGTGYWLVTYRAGLDVRGDPQYGPIMRVLRAHAVEHPESIRLWRTVGHGSAAGDRRTKTLSAEGQSVTYEFTGFDGTAESSRAVGASVGGPVLWASIDRWRTAGRRVFQRAGSLSPADDTGWRWT